MQRYRVWPLLDGGEVQMCSEGEYVAFADHEAAVRDMRGALENCAIAIEAHLSDGKHEGPRSVPLRAALSESRRVLEGGKG